MPSFSPDEQLLPLVFGLAAADAALLAYCCPKHVVRDATPSNGTGQARKPVLSPRTYANIRSQKHL